MGTSVLACLTEVRGRGAVGRWWWRGWCSSRQPICSKSSLWRSCRLGALGEGISELDHAGDAYVSFSRIKQEYTPASSPTGVPRVLSRRRRCISELVLWDALLNWAVQECGRQSLEVNAENQRKVLGECFGMVR
ncbi:BTB/POZ domain-containing protein 2 [Portunus trituberculatus]|uniref:BTB/POZ domain-containing protein 2 n=1 Tax=Portunus trituberculatus TaxID=210409 RepID=A0A5B7HHX6_PORTR|nr:BTB/POZ domain-containing protein 2 [Portunus trituberculatus]